MPTYEFGCQACGPFTAIRPMAQCRDPCACPQCRALAPRILLTAPAIATGGSARIARAASGPSGETARRADAAHPAGCGCCMQRSPLADSLAARGGNVFTSHGPAWRSGS